MAKRKATAKGKDGSKAGLLLLLLGLLAGLCAWNYQRNAALETAAKGPYSTLSDADLERLIEAYQSELESLTAGGSPGRAAPRATQGVAHGVREFERVQQASRSVREAGYAISEREGVVQALETERGRRRAQGGGLWMVILRRAFTF
jgi:hypothetical protein